MVPKNLNLGAVRVAGCLLATALWSGSAGAADKVTFLTSWFAQAEHGGFYQAKATGLYERAGLDVTLRMGGPQVNGMQLLLAGETDIMMGYDFQVLKMLEQGLAVVTIATSFQYDLQGMMTHDNVASLAHLKHKTILVATPGRTTWWPFRHGPTSRPVRTRLTCNPSSRTRTWCSNPIRHRSRSRPNNKGCRSSSFCSRTMAIRPMARQWSPSAISPPRLRTWLRAS
jgi:hypothetical protein